MHFFEIRTISLFSGLISAWLFICMLYIYKNRKTYPGFKQWTIAFMFNFFGAVLLSLRDVFPVLITVILANLLLLFFFVFIFQGLITFIDEKQNYWTDILLLSVFLIAFLHYSYHAPDVNARIVIISLLIALFCIRCLFTSHRQLSAMLSNENFLLSSAFILVALCFFLRAALTFLFEEPIADFMSVGVMHAFCFIAITIGHIVIAVGLIVINAQRLEQELIHANKEITTLKGFLPICANCKKIRDDKGYWKQIEEYISERSEARFSHGICPECAETLYPDLK